MQKRVKGGIEKHYCDKCGKNIFDYIPKKEKPTIFLFGMPVTEFSLRRHCDFRMTSSRENGLPRGEYCMECYEKGESNDNTENNRRNAHRHC